MEHFISNKLVMFLKYHLRKSLHMQIYSKTILYHKLSLSLSRNVSSMVEGHSGDRCDHITHNQTLCAWIYEKITVLNAVYLPEVNALFFTEPSCMICHIQSGIMLLVWAL